MNWMIYSYLTNESLKKRSDEIRQQIKQLETHQLKQEQEKVKKYIRLKKPANAKILYSSESYTKMFTPINPGLILISLFLILGLSSITIYLSDIIGGFVVAFGCLILLIWIHMSPRTQEFQITDKGIMLFGTFYFWEAMSNVTYHKVLGKLDVVQIELMSQLGHVDLLIEDADISKVKELISNYI